MAHFIELKLILHKLFKSFEFQMCEIFCSCCMLVVFYIEFSDLSHIFLVGLSNIMIWLSYFLFNTFQVVKETMSRFPTRWGVICMYFNNCIYDHGTVIYKCMYCLFQNKHLAHLSESQNFSSASWCISYNWEWQFIVGDCVKMIRDGSVAHHPLFNLISYIS